MRALLWLLLSLLLLACERTPTIGPPATLLAVAPGCNLLLGCSGGDGSIAVAVRADTEPQALRPFTLHLHATGESIKSVHVRFFMRGMGMGANRYQLIGDAAGDWRAAVTLPVCVSGRRDWVAEFDLRTERRRLQFHLPFVLQGS